MCRESLEAGAIIYEVSNAVNELAVTFSEGCCSKVIRMLSETHATSPHDHDYTSLRTVYAMNVNTKFWKILRWYVIFKHDWQRPMCSLIYL